MSEAVVAQPIAEGSKPTVVEKPKTEAEFMASRIAKRKERLKKPDQAPEKSPEASAAAQPTKESSPQVEKPSDEAKAAAKVADDAVLSKPISELTEEEIAILATKGKSGLLNRVAELSAKRKDERREYEERVAALEAKLKKLEPAMPERIENNPYASVEDLNTLQEKKREVDTLLETFDEVLDKADGMGASEIVMESEGRQYTKAEIKDLRRKAIKAKDKYLPAQYSEIVLREQGKQLEAHLSQRVRKEIPWIEKDEDETKKHYASMINDPRILKAKRLVPELAPQLDFILAHATNSIFGRRTIAEEKQPNGKSASITPPSSPSTSAAAPTNVDARRNGSLKELENRFKESGKERDWLALREAKHQSRKSI